MVSLSFIWAWIGGRERGRYGSLVPPFLPLLHYNYANSKIQIKHKGNLDFGPAKEFIWALKLGQKSIFV